MARAKGRETAETLRKLTERSRTRLEKREATKRLREDQELTRRAQPLGRAFIRKLQKEIKSAVRRGEYSVRLFDSLTINDQYFGKIAGIVSDHCWKKGLNPKTEHYTSIGSDGLPPHDTFYVSWEK